MGFTTLQAQQRGKASYYAKKATGARTSNGERLHHDSLTCAHRRFPFGTRLKVTNLTNDKQVIVRVNDRGPFIKGRIIDLSWGAAKELGILSAGVCMVLVEEYQDEIVVPLKAEEKMRLPEIDFESLSPSFPRVPSLKNKEEWEKKLKTLPQQNFPR